MRIKQYGAFLRKKFCKKVQLERQFDLLTKITYLFKCINIQKFINKVIYSYPNTIIK